MPPCFRNGTPLPIARVRGALAALALSILVLAGSPAVQAQARADHRVDVLPAATLLSAPPASLVDPIRQRRARTIADYQDAVFVAWALAPILAFLWLYQSGSAAGLRDLLRRRFSSRQAARAVFGGCLGLLAGLAQAPFAFAAHRIASNVGLTMQSTGAWLGDEVLRLAVIAVVVALLVLIVLELVDRTRLWYLAFIAVLYVTVLSVVAIEAALLAPLATGMRPAPAPIVAESDAIAHALGVAPVAIVIAASSQRSRTLTARTAGIAPFDRIILGDETVARLSPGERRFLLARLYADLRDHATLSLALIATTLFVLCAAIAIRISDRIGFRRDDDALSRLALVGAFLLIAVMALYPVYNTIEREMLSHADDAALAVTSDPASAVRLLVRRADDDLTPLCGRRTTRWYFASRPAIGTRIAISRNSADPCPR
jgi:hypothetical protein